MRSRLDKRSLNNPRWNLAQDDYNPKKNKSICFKQVSLFYLLPAFAFGCFIGFLVMSHVLLPNQKSDIHIVPTQTVNNQIEKPVTVNPVPNEKKNEPEPTKKKNDVQPAETHKVDASSNLEVAQMRDAIRNATINAYRDFDRICHGQDELWPVGKKCHNWVNMGLTVVDSLDTLYLMGFKEDFDKAVEWIKTSLSLSPTISISFFETVIRCLGGLLSAYALSGEQILLDKAAELGEKLFPAFKTGTGLPMSQINVNTKKIKNPGWSGGGSLLAEIGTIQLEFGYLSEVTGDPKFADAAFKVFDILDPQNGKIPPLRFKGQYPIYISPHDLSFKTTHISWGAMGDSFYEYLLKLWILTGKKSEQYKRMYIDSIDGMFEHLWVSNPNGLDYVAEFKGGSLQRKMDHLACFTSGLLALGVLHEVVDGEKRDLHLKRSISLAETCHQMYHQMKSGLSPEYVTFNRDGKLNPGVDFYILRPETVESFFLLWRVTKDQKWRDYGWEIFQAIQKHCRIEGAGYVPVLNVNHEHPRQDPNGKMQSFLIAETFKYLFLLFSDDDALSLHDFVFNTEAHPLPVFSKP